METSAASYPIPAGANMLLSAGIAAFQLFVLFALPLWLLPQSPYWMLVVLPLLWLHSTHWGLVHEGIHKIFSDDTRVNDLACRGLSILMGASFHVLKFGHLIHHQLNRDWHPEFVKEKNWSARASYYFTLFAGLYLSEVLGSFLLAILPKRAFLHLARTRLLKDYPQVIVAGERFFFARGNIAKLRLDVALVVLLYGSAFYVYGALWPLLALFVASRALVISFMDNIYHYDTPGDNSKPGKELHLPGFLSKLILHNNYHDTHHRAPDVPWTSLPAHHTARGGSFDGAFLAHGKAQFLGPIVSLPVLVSDPT